MRKSSKSSLLSCVCLISLSLAATAAWAAPRNFDIPAQDAVKAIPEFGRQAGVQVVAPADRLTGIRTTALRGMMEAKDALLILLQGTGLEVASDDGRVIVLRARGGLTQASGNAPSSGGAAAQGSSTEAASDDKSLDRSDQPTSPTNDTAENVEKVTVTGSRIRGVKKLPVPSQTITRDDISKTGASSVEDVFKKIPQNLSELSTGGGFGQGVSTTASSNAEQASGISLRGLGPESTLTLINGRRRAGTVVGKVVDVSVIPLSMVDRIEIVTGGRSAVYGSDAVAGVVNIVLRRSFEGADTEAFYGTTEAGGAERFQISQVFGQEYERGGFVASYQYTQESAFDLLRTDVLRAPSPADVTPRVVDIVPERHQHAAALSGSFSPDDGVEIYGDVLYTQDDRGSQLAYDTPFSTFDRLGDISSEQFSVAAGVKLALTGDWYVDASLVHSVADDKNKFLTTVDGSPSSVSIKNRATLTQWGAVADGSVLLGDLQLKTALGLEWREEKLSAPRYVVAPLVRDIKSASLEVLVPLLGDTSRANSNALELSLAGRYDDYSDFGNTLNPQLGVRWTLEDGLTLRTAYSTAFRAPALVDLGSTNSAFIFPIDDPLAPSGASPVLFWLGGNPMLQPEEATTWSAGADYELPLDFPLKVSFSYFEIDYQKRIDEPVGDLTQILNDETLYGALVDRSPTSLRAASILTPALIDSGGFFNGTSTPFDPLSQDVVAVFPDLVIFDGRRGNIGQNTLKGIDFGVDSRWSLDQSLFTFSIAATHYFELDRQITSTSPKFSELNVQGKPVDFRLKATLGWEFAEFGAFAYLNYADGYRDTTSLPSRKIDSWTTIDLSLRYDLKIDEDADDDHALRISFNVDNVFDQDPPEFLGNFFGLGYDPANADPLGRQFSLRVGKRW